MNEIWKDIPGYVGTYQISNLGRVRSIPRTIIDKNGTEKNLPGKILSVAKYSNGYCFVGLANDGITKQQMIHRLVLLAFVASSDLEVNHKDGNKSNNALDNLEYVTHSENICHSYQRLNRKINKPYLGKRGYEHNKSIVINVRNIETGQQKQFGSIRIASEEMKFARCMISKAIKTQQPYKGYLFYE